MGVSHTSPLPDSDVALELASAEQRPLLDMLVQAYLAEMSPMSGDQPDVSGRYPYQYLPLYWTEDGRYPFFIRSNGHLAGFVLVRRLPNEVVTRYSIAEFYVRPSFRGTSVGRVAAYAVFDRWPGHWHVAQMENNTAAQSFWRRVVGDYTNGNYDEAWDDDTGGPAQLFQTS